MFQSIDEIQRIFDFRRILAIGGNIQIELIGSSLQCLLETSRLVPRMFSSRGMLHLLVEPVDFFLIHVC